MERGRECRAALAAVAATAGAGYASGRELVLFFAQLGATSWLGVAFASVCFGLLAAALCRAVVRVGPDAPGGFLRPLLGRRVGTMANMLYSLLMSLTAAVMLAGAGEIGALTLPLENGFLWGAVLALAAALGLILSYNKAVPVAGLLTLLAGAGLYAGLALDPRAVRVYARAETSLALENSTGAAILLAAMYAALNACIAGDALLRFSHRRLDAGRVGLMCGGMMAILLSCANAAILRGGRDLLSQAMPTVILAARWGAPGFWLCAGFTFLCNVGTLAAALGALLRKLEAGGGERAAGILLLTLAAALAVTRGLDGAVARVYPALGWLCALGVGAVAGRLERRDAPSC